MRNLNIFILNGHRLLSKAPEAQASSNLELPKTCKRALDANDETATGPSLVDDNDETATGPTRSARMRVRGLHFSWLSYRKHDGKLVTLDRWLDQRLKLRKRAAKAPPPPPPLHELDAPLPATTHFFPNAELFDIPGCIVPEPPPRGRFGMHNKTFHCCNTTWAEGEVKCTYKTH